MAKKKAEPRTDAKRKAAKSSKKSTRAKADKPARKKAATVTAPRTKAASPRAKGPAAAKAPSKKSSRAKSAPAADAKAGPHPAPAPAAAAAKPSKAAKPAPKSSKHGRPAAKPRSGRDGKSAAAPKPPPSLADAKAAALRLAAAAGLRPVERHHDNGDAAQPAAQRLTKSPLGKRELERFREDLLQKRHQVVGDVSAMETEALSGAGSGSLSSLPQHMADQGSDEYDQSLALGIAASQRVLLREIDDAIDRIDRGEFGICEMLGVAIEKERLESTPWTRYSLEGARLMDRRSHGR